MTDDLDRILAGEPEARPSSRFARNVMAAVRREAVIPPPIGFPWRRALPGLVAVGVVLVALVGLVVWVAMASDVAPPQSADREGRTWLRLLAWISLGCLASWATVRAAMTLSERRDHR